MTAHPNRRRPRSTDASMGLLADVVARALDPGYAEAAARPPTERPVVARLARSTGSLALAAVLGVATVVAVAQLRVPDDGGPSPRGLLEREITERASDADELARTAERISAEAIAINGQRLTAVSAIRSAGEAVLVGLAPVLPPYRVEAIGDIGRMQTAFARSTASGHLTFLSGAYGITTSITSEQDLQLPGSASATWRHASRLPGVGSSSPAEEKNSS